MSAPMRRGACPSLAVPMLTGDGWLARLSFTEPLEVPQTTGICEVAERLGNGLVEVTARGSLQIRGLDEGAPLAAALAPLGLPLAEGVPVIASPLAGRDPAERADPRPLAAVLRAFRGPLPPKVSAVVDGGGSFPLDALAADVRLAAIGGGWRVGVGGTAGSARWLGAFEAEAAAALGLELLGEMSRHSCRGRDLDVAGGKGGQGHGWTGPVRRFVLRPGVARGVAFPFGVTGAEALSRLAQAAAPARLVPAPGRCMIALGIEDEAGFLAAAERLGFVTDARDARLGIAACAGAPACASGRIATRAIAARIASEGRLAGVRLHLSGCPKRCAQPAGPVVTLVAGETGPQVTGDGRPVPEAVGRYLLEAATW